MMKSKLFFLFSFIQLFMTGCTGSGLQGASPRSLYTRGESHEHAARLNVELGLGYLAQGQISRAKSKMVHALELAPDSSEAHSAMGFFYDTVRDFDKAEKEYKRAIELGAGLGALHNNYGAFLCRAGRIDEAIDQFNIAIEDEKYARTAEVYENAGLCLVNHHRAEKAEEFLKTSLDRDPQRIQAALELVDIYIEQNKYCEATEVLNVYHDIHGTNARSLLQSVKIFSAMQDIEKMKTYAHALKEQYPDSREYHLYQTLPFREAIS